VRSTSDTGSAYYVAKEVAQLLDCSVDTIYRRLSKGTLLGYLLGGSVWRIPKVEVHRLRDAQRKLKLRPPAKKGRPRFRPPVGQPPGTCPHCDTSKRQIKAGRNRTGTQRFLCRACERYYTRTSAPQGYSEATRREVLRLHRAGESLRTIGRLVGVNHQTVSNWIKAPPDKKPFVAR
jgi:excisionase family DNA binding protein